MNIDNLTGIEFEQLCKKLLEEYGFRVETTKASGDGGIDLIAYSDKLFYKGKYIIQCKRYIGSVGEPVIRDLYGVVTAERANKGILITSGSFTNAAIKFSENKPIELIDLPILNKLMSDDSYIEEDKVRVTTVLNIDTYNYYLKQISDSNSDYAIIVKFLDFVLSYIIDTEKEKQYGLQFNKLLFNCKDTIEQKIIELNRFNSADMLKPLEQQFIERDIIKNIELGLIRLANSTLCRTKTGKLYQQNLQLKYNGIKQLLATDISSFFEDRLIFLDSIGSTYREHKFYENSYRDSNKEFSSSCDLFNLYSLCNYLEYYNGFEKLNKKYSYNCLMNSNYEFINFDYKNIIESKLAIIIYPEIYFINPRRNEFNRNYIYRINFTSYFDKLISAETREEIIKKIDFLLSL